MVAVFFALYTLTQVFMVVKFMRLKSKAVIWESLFLYFFFGVFLVLRSIYNLNIPKYTIVLAISTFIGHSFLGRGLNFYNSSKHFDRYLHAFGSFSFALFSYNLILQWVNPAVNTRMLTALFVFTLGVALSVLHEMVEFFADSISKSKTNQRGLQDTNFDILANIIGSLTAAVFTYFTYGVR